ncbi:hypothetical protein FRC10_008923 [Ceratobasidium sp. 414]|nr:hypothetical protein FRC10_008923 [Ceratobasidium sp. 414]
MFHRLSLVVFTLFMCFAAVVRADFPSCALHLGSCSSTDNACLCQNVAYCNATNNCYHSSCNVTDWKAAYDYSVAMCNAAGVYQNYILNPPPSKRDFVPVYFGYVYAYLSNLPEY